VYRDARTPLGSASIRSCFVLITSVTWSFPFRTDIFTMDSFLAREKKLSILDEGVFMGQKLSAGVIVVGCLLMVLGLTLLAAGRIQSQDETISGAGICAFSFGALTCAGGMYLKARALQATTPASTVKPAKTRGGCDLCGTETPAVMCRAHQLHLCPACLARHYDVRSCVYAPSSRRPAAKAARA